MKAPVVHLVQDMSMRVSDAETKRVEQLGECGQKTLGPTQTLLGPSSSRATDYIRLSPDIVGLLASRGIAPVVLEHEKALLVIKEHDYAKAPERPDILQLSNIHKVHNIYRTSLEERERYVASPRKSPKDFLLNCRSDIARLREKVSQQQDESLVGTHFRNVISLQVALIREQQEQLHEKDRELNAMRKEKEQLEARLERMERRMAILQKRTRGREDSEPNTPTPKAHLSRRKSLIHSETQTRSRSSSLDRTRIRSRTTSRPGTPGPLDERDTPSGGKKGSKRKSRGDTSDAHEVKRPRKKTPEPSVIRTKIEYSGLDLPLSRDSSSRRSSVVDIAVNYCSLENDKSNSSTVLVPTWRLCPVEASKVEGNHPQDTEEVSEEGFLKRHKKLEEDERRRKRWDIQRARALREHEELLRKYSKKGGQAKEKKNEKVYTLLPKLQEIESIEIMDTITVSAFGAPIPLLKPSEFSLPWFDLDARDAKESVRTTRSMARAGRTSLSSSGTEES